MFSGVLALLGIEDSSWLSMKAVLSRSGIISEILHFDARKVTKSIRKKVSKLIKVS